MDKAFYEAEIDALRRQLVNVQKVAIERGEAIIRAHEEIRRLHAESYNRKYHGGPGLGVVGGGGAGAWKWLP